MVAEVASGPASGASVNLVPLSIEFVFGILYDLGDWWWGGTGVSWACSRFVLLRQWDSMVAILRAVSAVYALAFSYSATRLESGRALSWAYEASLSP